MSNNGTIGNLFENIGIAGWGSLEAPILCALKAKIPVNLIGDKGTSKTELTHRLSRALLGNKCRFQKYDTPDVSLDQILGFLNIKKMEEGEVSFVRTGTSIWDKTAVTWDEISRVGPMLQGKLLEVIRTGEIHGLKTDVKIQFATVNPPRRTRTSAGHDTQFLGDALASRFFHVHVPSTSLAIFDKALQLSDIREDYNTDNFAAIGRHSKNLATLWIDFSAAKPTEDEKNTASKIVRAILASVIGSKSGYFDTRAALRTVTMLSELFCLVRIHEPTRTDLIEHIQNIVIGNIAELNGIVRNDHSGDVDSVRATVMQTSKSLITHTKTASQTNIISKPFLMVQQGTFDELTMSSYVVELKSELGRSNNINNFVGALSSFVTKMRADNKYRSTAFRASHKMAISKILDVGVEYGHMTYDIKILKEIFHIDLNPANSITGSAPSSAEMARLIHNKWYELCDLGNPS